MRAPILAACRRIDREDVERSFDHGTRHVRNGRGQIVSVQDGERRRAGALANAQAGVRLPDRCEIRDEELAEGQFDRAQDLARQADAANPSGRWGLFDDTPESLEGDIRKARTKAWRAIEPATSGGGQ